MTFGDTVVEFDGAYWHNGKQDRDSAKTTRLTDAGYRVARIREDPLGPLTKHDILVAADQPFHLTTAATLLALPAKDFYIQQGKHLARDAANSMIALRLPA